MNHLIKYLLVAFLISLCSQFSYADYSVGRINRETKIEKDGFKWTLVSTRHGANGTITEGVEINGKTVFPLYKGLAYFRYCPVGDGGIFEAMNVELPGTHKEYVYLSIDGKIIFETDNLYASPAYNDEKGLHFTYHGTAEYPKQKLDCRGRIWTKNIAKKSPATPTKTTTPTKQPSDLELRKESNGYTWYKVKKNGKVGVLDANHKEILPPIYSWVSYHSYSVGENDNEKEPFFQADLKKQNGKTEHLAFTLKGKPAKYKRIKRTVDGFTYVDVFNRGEGRWSIEDGAGNVIIPEDCHASTIFYFPSTYMGGFFQLTFLGGGLTSELYNRAGNLIIPKSRNYWQIRLQNKSDKFFVTQTKDGIGMCDLNGYEIVKPGYEQFEYDGFDFVGTTKSGQRVRKNIHSRPTPKQTQKIKQWGGYYSNMPWLMMPGPSYTPKFDINWNATSIDWNSVPIYGGIGDYESVELNENTSIGGTSHNSSGHKCAYCNGTGRKAISQNIVTFGTADVKVHCNECGRDYYRSSGHSHVQCGHCGGTGRAK